MQSDRLVHTRVNELEGITPQTLDERILTSTQPIVLRGFGSDWPIVKAGLESDKAAIAYLKQVWNGRPITTCRGNPETKGRIYYNEQMTGFNFKATNGDFVAFMEEILAETSTAAPRALYMPSTDVSAWFPQFGEEQPAGLEHLKPIKLLWAGNRTRIAAHYDFPDNIACSVVGRRRFTLFPPDQVSNLYPGPMEFAPGGQEISMVDLHAPDFETFPKFKEALTHAQVAELEPGDALFLPGMWWHHVDGLDDLNVLYTHWWRNSPGFMGRPTNALLLGILSLRGLSYEQRQAWRALFDHFVFNPDPDDIQNIPEEVQGMLKLPMDELSARKLRADLLNRLKV
ncbi:cupin-like domain-containing protein [Marinimicrobium sp. ABcell2]|uniref:cupin-like domain-containing protein n=1 Tax=Marinimicrobium sp. ABcell2 TaxID=3069751 RepID=UPI0027B87B0B|nr:cupin-like domain-containing protein [Marinimicrobium sp. ABcell2]MDQ2075878.1 cupin-like domain-containing protein [Marinimicrobium sp. ABcell2]